MTRRDVTDYDPPHQYGNVSNGDGRQVKNWLLAVFALLLGGTGTALGVLFERVMDRQVEDEARIRQTEIAQATINGKLDLILYRMEKAERKHGT